MIEKIIFLGSPGVGKGTLAKILASNHNLEHISTGDIFRYHIKNQTELGQKVKEILQSGEYVPDELTNEILKRAVEEALAKGKGFILDGYPRTKNQAVFLESQGYEIQAVVLLEAPFEVIKERLLFRSKKEKRTDDNLDIISERIRVYNQKTKPLITYYQNKNLIIKLKADQDIETVYQNLLKELNYENPA